MEVLKFLVLFYFLSSVCDVKQQTITKDISVWSPDDASLTATQRSGQYLQEEERRGERHKRQFFGCKFYLFCFKSGTWEVEVRELDCPYDYNTIVTALG